jgi:hypothetical protein
MSEIREAIVAEAKAAGVHPDTALELLEGKAFQAEQGVYVRAGAGVVSDLKSAVADLVPIAVRSQTEHERATYDYVMRRRAQRAATPAVPETAPAQMSTADYLAHRKAARKAQRGA